MSEGDRLGVLQVGHSGRRASRRAAPACSTRASTSSTSRAATPAGVVAQVQPQVGGDLVVAGAPGAQLAAERAEPLQQTALQRRVHVLVLDRRAGTRPTRRRPRGHRARRASGRARRCRAGRPGEHARVGARRGQIVRRQPPVELHAHRQPGQRLRRAAGNRPPHSRTVVTQPSSLWLSGVPFLCRKR